MDTERHLAAALAAAFLWALLMPSPVTAEQSAGTGPQSAHLHYSVNVPQILSLRIGSEGGTVDTVSFSPPVSPKNDWINASSGGSQIVQIAGIVSPSTTIRLTADSSLPLSDGGHTIPFSQFRQSGSGPFSSVADLAFTGATDQLIWSASGPGMRQGSFTYQYYNAASTPSGSFSGTITYTVATL